MATSEWGLFEWGEAEWGSGESGAPPGTDIEHDETIPVDATMVLNRDESIPWENDGAETVTVDVSIPIDNTAGGTRIERDEEIPIDVTGEDPNRLLLIWSVKVRLDTPFQLSWNVVAAGLNQSLTLQWNVRQTMPPLTLRWNVIPDILNPLINNDIQMPVGIVTITP